jgi:hypothetical protein
MRGVITYKNIQIQPAALVLYFSARQFKRGKLKTACGGLSLLFKSPKIICRIANLFR